ncbi:MAG TPA: flagellar biosynthesis protein FlgM [Thiotrichaceae bacterium]|nr:flagellar biosynthesis protein FlgM [Thiotrichaceae bacterium]
MRWKNKRRSSNIEDRRSNRRLPRGTKRVSGSFILFAIVAIFVLMGRNPLKLLDEGAAPQQQAQNSTQQSSAPDENADFVSVILASTEDAWSAVFQAAGYRYQPPKLVLFTDHVRSACGMTSSATGPFYCPGDSKIYIDLGFFQELQAMGAKGDFARAYVLAHEVGHHIQNLEGTSMKIQNLQRRSNKHTANKLSVLTELQADCYAGIWIHHYEKQNNILEPGDIEEGIRAAASIGDDRMQRNAGQHVNPDSFTHGSSKDRTHWLKVGMKYGDTGRCNTFKHAGTNQF